ncbi:MAG: dodecin domain-containing protein [Chlorobi bacterium]|nr:dodecin domain-containing protein [Chlorobiota bacterium]
MAVIKVIELMANSSKSWEDATQKAIKKASKTVKGIRSAYVKDQSVVVKGGEITEYRVTLKVSFEIK